MSKRRTLTIIAAFILAATLTFTRIAAQTRESNSVATEKNAVEATVRSYEEACQAFDHEKAVALIAPDAKWIEHSVAEPADDWTGWWTNAKGKIRIQYHLRDFETHIRGDVAWVTLTIDGTFTALNDEGRALNANEQESRTTFAESEVLLKTANGWRIALGHTSELPAKAPAH